MELSRGNVQFAIVLIAAYAMITGARGRFGLKNKELVWN